MSQIFVKNNGNLLVKRGSEFHEYLPILKIDGVQGWEKFEAVLKHYPDELRKGQIKVLNRVATGIRTDIAKAVKRRGYTLRADQVKRAIWIKKARFSNPYIRVLVRAAKSTHITDWDAWQTQKGVSFQKRKGKISQMDHAFIARGIHSKRHIVFIRTGTLIDGKEPPTEKIEAKYTSTAFDFLKSNKVRAELRTQAVVRMRKVLLQEYKYRVRKVLDIPENKK